jgi:hypothetical protein
MKSRKFSSEALGNFFAKANVGSPTPTATVVRTLRRRMRLT